MTDIKFTKNNLLNLMEVELRGSGIKNKGDVAEGLLAAAIYVRFVKGEDTVTTQDVARTLADFKKSGGNGLNTNIKRKDGTVDNIALEIKLAPVSFADLLDPRKKKLLIPLYNSVVKYANSKTLLDHSVAIAVDNHSSKILILADGVSDQKGTKVDIRIFKDGKELPIGKLSLKAGTTKQLGQIGKGWRAQSGKSRGIYDLFKSLFGIELDGWLEEEYTTAIASKDKVQMLTAIHDVYENAFDKIEAIYGGRGSDEWVQFIKTLANGVRKEAVLEEEGVILVHLDKGDFKALDFSNIEKKFLELDIDIEVDFDSPGQEGFEVGQVPYLRVFDAGSEANLLSIRAKVREKEFRHYVQKEPALSKLLQIL